MTRSAWRKRSASVVALALWPTLAYGGNAAEPRVPPSFLGTRCIEVIGPDDPPLHLSIGIALEQGEPTADEPPGTRSFQFFAACREPHPGDELPPWIEVADVEAARAANPELGQPDASLVLPTSSWAQCLVPLTPSDSRMPIECAATADGVDVSPDALPPGNYVIYGYTYEPDKNLWTARDGVVRVVGAGGADALPPAVTLTYPLSDAVASTGAGVMVTGCAMGLPGTEVELAWATVGDLAAFGADAWQAFDTIVVDDASADDSSFEVPFTPPSSADYSVVRLRARATDPEGREWISYSRPPLVLEPGCADPQGGLPLNSDLCGIGPATGPPADPRAAHSVCVAEQDEDPGAETDGSDGSGGSGGSDGEGPDTVEANRVEASGCRVGGPCGPAIPPLLLALILVARPRRR